MEFSLTEYWLVAMDTLQSLCWRCLHLGRTCNLQWFLLYLVVYFLDFKDSKKESHRHSKPSRMFNEHKSSDIIFFLTLGYQISIYIAFIALNSLFLLNSFTKWTCFLCFLGQCFGSINQYWLLPWQHQDLSSGEISWHACKELSRPGELTYCLLQKEKSELNPKFPSVFQLGTECEPLPKAPGTVFLPKSTAPSVCEAKLAFSSFVRYFLIATRTVINIRSNTMTCKSPFSMFLWFTVLLLKII